MDAPPDIAMLFKADGRVVITAEARTNPNPPASWTLAPPLELLELLIPWPLLHAL
jgi:hypothetical protein